MQSKKIFAFICFIIGIVFNSFSQNSSGCSIAPDTRPLPQILYKENKLIVYCCKVISSTVTSSGNAYSIAEIKDIYFGNTNLKQIKVLTGHFTPPPAPKPPPLLIPPPKPIKKTSYDVPYIDDGISLIDPQGYSNWGIKMQIDSSYIIYTANDTGYNQTYIETGYLQRSKPLKNTPAVKKEIETLRLFRDIINKKKSGHYIFKDEKGMLFAEGNYKKGKLSGVWKNYDAKGNLSSWEDFQPNKCKVFYLNGNLKEKITSYKDSSVTKNYFDNPKSQVYLKTITPKNDTSANIIIYEYYTTGVVKEKHEEHHYRYIGLYWEFYPNGKVNTISEYNLLPQNYRNGIYQQYYPNGQLKLDAHVINARRVGCWTWYNEDGSFMAEWDYTDGKAPQ